MSVYAGPEIVNDGLVLCLDAANVKSYPGSGTTWTNLVDDKTLIGTLTNGPTYNTQNGGSFVCDGVSNYITYGNPASMAVTVNSSFSIITVFKILSSTLTTTTVVFGKGSQVGSHGIGFLTTSLATYRILMGVRSVEGIDITSTDLNANLNQIYFAAMTYTPQYLNTYVNGTKVGDNIDTSSLAGGTLDNDTWETFRNRAVTSGNIAYGNGHIYLAGFYNRALTAAEIQQNFNALRGRFGI